MSGNSLLFRVFFDGVYRSDIALGLVPDSCVLLMSEETIDELADGGQTVACIAQMCFNPSVVNRNFGIKLSGTVGGVEFVYVGPFRCSARRLEGVSVEIYNGDSESK